MIMSHQIFGMMLIVASSLVINFGSKSLPEPIDNVQYDPTFPTWIPVVFGILCPLWFAIHMVLIKHTCEPIAQGGGGFEV